jgi:hypothetical protein
MFGRDIGNRKGSFNVFAVKPEPNVFPGSFRKIMIDDMVAGKESESLPGFDLVFLPVSPEYTRSLLYGMYAVHRGSLFPMEVTATFEKTHVRNKNIPAGVTAEPGTYGISVLLEYVHLAPN